MTFTLSMEGRRKFGRQAGAARGVLRQWRNNYYFSDFLAVDPQSLKILFKSNNHKLFNPKSSLRQWRHSCTSLAGDPASTTSAALGLAFVFHCCFKSVKNLQLTNCSTPSTLPFQKWCKHWRNGAASGGAEMSDSLSLEAPVIVASNIARAFHFTFLQNKNNSKPFLPFDFILPSALRIK